MNCEWWAPPSACSVQFITVAFQQNIKRDISDDEEGESVEPLAVRKCYRYNTGVKAVDALTMRFIWRVQRAQYHTNLGSFTSLSVTWGLWHSWWYRLWHSWHSTSWFPDVTVICLLLTRKKKRQINHMEKHYANIVLALRLTCIGRTVGLSWTWTLVNTTAGWTWHTCTQHTLIPSPWQSRQRWSRRCSWNLLWERL